MLKITKFLLKKIFQYDKAMIAIIISYTLLATIQPFIWILVPTKVISLSYTGDMRSILFYILTGGTVSIISVILLSFFIANFRMRANSVRYHLIRDISAYSLAMPYENLLDPNHLSKIQLAEEAIRNPRRGIMGILNISLRLIGNILASLGLLGLMSTLSPWIMILIFILVMVQFYFRIEADRFNRSTRDSVSDAERKYFKTTDLMKEPDYAKDIRIYSLINIMETYAKENLEVLKNIVSKSEKKYTKADIIEAFLNIIRDLTVFTYISYMLLEGKIEVSQFFLYTTGTISLVTILQEMLKQIAEIFVYTKGVKAYMELLESPTIVEDKDDIQIREKLDKESFTIEIKDLVFRYPNSTEKILDKLNLTINSGEKLALVGENGAGKSTLIKILCKLYKPTSGNIYINGVDINEIPESIYWDLVGVVFQDALLLPFSVKENIGLTNIIDKEKLMKSINNADLNQIVSEMQNGVDTILLRTLDDEGIDLSGGQRQKLYLARAIYKRNRLLILDEPTSALDPLAEAELYKKYNILSKGKTSIYISHRLASTKFCDKVAYIKDGKILEIGTHDELMDLGGEYNKIFNIQSKYYKNIDEMEAI